MTGVLDPISNVGRVGKALRVLDRLVRGTPEERAKIKVLRQLVVVVSAELTEATLESELTEAIEEHLAFPSDVPSGSTSLADALRSAWKDQLSGLFEPLEADETSNAISNLGAEVGLDGLVDALLRQLPKAIGLYGSTFPSLAVLGTELRHNLQSESLELAAEKNQLNPSLMQRHRFGEQALEVDAFVQLAGVDLPRVTVDNDSDAAITDIEVACWLQAFEPGVHGQPVALIGSNIPFLSVREIAPKSAWAWSFGGPGWNDQERVRSQLHVYFRDASGQRWLAAHDSLQPLDE